MINHINSSLVQGLQAKTTQKKESGDRSKTHAEPDATLQVRYAPIIAQAMETPAADANAVESAKKMLVEGELNKPEVIREAARNIVENGV